MGKETPRKTRPLFVSFVAIKTKVQIFSLRRNLKNTKISISEDCPKDISTKRKELLPALLGARKMNKKAYFKLDKLWVNGTLCSDDEIEIYKKANNESNKRTRQTEGGNSPNNSINPKRHRSVTLTQKNGRVRSSSLSSDSMGDNTITKFLANTKNPVPSTSADSVTATS
jgi:hypothetical protein